MSGHLGNLFVIRLWKKQNKALEKTGSFFEKAWFINVKLRGWELEKESGMLQGKPLERHLSWQPRLLSLWAHSMLSSVLVTNLADLAMQDKADHVELVALAKTCTWMPDPFHAPVSWIDPKETKETAIFHHLVFADLGKGHPDFLNRCATLEKVSRKSFRKVSKPLVMII